MPKSTLRAGRAVSTASEKPSSSPGDASVAETPKDVSADNATARDRVQRNLSSDNLDEREEALLDDAIELTFPASDPIAVPSYAQAQDKQHAGKRSTRIPKPGQR